uniref:5'-nucleotidase n=1 Tax=Myxobolus squamalis TaxID=59785 RepID=A0A6B2FYM7_MYXSQ
MLHIEKIDLLCANLLENKNIHISNINNFKKILLKIRKDSHENRTVSSYRSNDGQLVYTSFQTLLSHKDEIYHMSQKENDLREKYVWIEFSKEFCLEEKIPHMIEWWSKANDIIIESGISRDEVAEAAKCPKLIIREGFVDLIKTFNNHKIPVMIASAGAGDIVYHKIKNEIGHENIEFCSNFLTYDENDIVNGISQPIIHSYNKHVITEIKKNYFEKQKLRKNIIVIGDSIGDVHMIKPMPIEILPLKIGFINFDSEILIESYLTEFDIILIDPSSLRPLEPIFTFILNIE